MLIKKSFIELRARERAKALLDSGSFRELLGPFDFIESPWLEKQNIVPQADDGMVIAKGTFGGKACCVAAIEGLSRAEAWVKCQAPRWRRCLSLPSKTLRQGIRLL